jgi:magnesium transporter
MSTDPSAAAVPEPELNADLLRDQPALAASMLEAVSTTEAVRLFLASDIQSVVPVLEQLPHAQARKILEQLDLSWAVGIISRVSIPRAALLLRVMQAERRGLLLDNMEPILRQDIQLLLDSPADTAAAMMDPRVLHLHPAMQVQAALDMLRAQQFHRKPTQARRILLLLDDARRIQGMVAIQDLAMALPDETLRTYMQRVPATVHPSATREQILEVLEAHRVSSLPVVDAEQRLVGIVRQDELNAIARESAAGDIQVMFGVSRAEQALSPPLFSVSQRLPWLQINLFTAFAAAAVVGLFEDTIASYTALAILLPVVAGQSGNAGAQALAVVMRGLTLREITTSNWMQVLNKELLVSVLNGLGVALTTAFVVYLWSQSVGLTSIIALAMVVSMMIAGISGAAVPLLLSRLGLDPAQSASIILTTVTDIAGFFSFLGIATLLLSTL